MSVARNGADLYLHNSRIYKWDVCAANAITNSVAGGRMTDINGVEVNYSSDAQTHVTGLVVATSNFDYYLQKILDKSTD
jgi:inositol monophosphatase 3